MGKEKKDKKRNEMTSSVASCLKTGVWRLPKFLFHFASNQEAPCQDLGKLRFLGNYTMNK